MKSMELKAYNLPANRILFNAIDAKPVSLFLFLILIGVMTLFTDLSKLYGFTIITISCFALIFMPRVTLIEFCQDFFVMYNKADKNTCVMIYYDEVASWHYVWKTNHDYLYVELIDGSEQKIEAFSKPIFETCFNIYMKDKRKKTAK